MWKVLAMWARRFADWADPLPIVPPPEPVVQAVTVKVPVPAPVVKIDEPDIDGKSDIVLKAARAVVWETVRLPKSSAYKRAAARIQLKKLLPDVPDHYINRAIEVAICAWHEKRARTTW